MGRAPCHESEDLLQIPSTPFVEQPEARSWQELFRHRQDHATHIGEVLPKRQRSQTSVSELGPEDVDAQHIVLVHTA